MANEVQPTERSLVSFIVPTLNRGRYVSRAVQSCLLNANAGADIEVVVVDSSSDDGSFEDLERKFGQDNRVILLQNARTSGPVKSWIEGVEAAKGAYMTFVWSDDIVSPIFLRTLLPALQQGALIAYGLGENFDADGELTFPETAPDAVFIEVRSFVRHYYGQDGGVSFEASGPMVSPICSLFDAELVREWTSHVRDFCFGTPLRKRIMWDGGIGPDLMLYLSAMAPGRPEIAYVRVCTAQFSEHPGSISISSKPSVYKMGYWFAKRWFIERFYDGVDDRSKKSLWGDVTSTGRLILSQIIKREKDIYLFKSFCKEFLTFSYAMWRKGIVPRWRNRLTGSAAALKKGE